MYMNQFRFRSINMVTNRGCKNNPDVFFCTCGEFKELSNRKKRDDSVEGFFHSYFQMKHGDQDKSWASYANAKIAFMPIQKWQA